MLIHVLYHGVQSVSPSLVVVEFQRANIDVVDGTSCSGETSLRNLWYTLGLASNDQGKTVITFYFC